MFRPVAVLLGIGLLSVVDTAAAQKPHIERNPKDGAEMILIPEPTRPKLREYSAGSEPDRRTAASEP